MNNSLRLLRRWALLFFCVNISTGLVSGQSSILSRETETTGKQESTSVASSVEATDAALYGRALTALTKGEYPKARLLSQRLISSHPRSDFARDAFLMIGDSLRQEGGASLPLAEAQYQDYLVFYPSAGDADRVQMNIVLLTYQRMGQAPVSAADATKARTTLEKLIRDFPNSRLAPVAKEMLRDIDDLLAGRKR